MSPAAFDAPYHLLQVLPRSLWLAAVVAACGEREARLRGVQHWLQALREGRLPDAAADFGDAELAAALRQAVAELGLPALCERAGALAEQVLRTVLWHGGRLPALQPRLSRSAAVARVAQDFRSEWQLQWQQLEAALALVPGLGGLQAAAWDALRGQLQRREWGQAQALAALLQRLPELEALVRRLGRSRVAEDEAPQPQAREATVRSAPVRWVETRLPDAPGDITGLRHGQRLERMPASEAAQMRHPVLRKLWRARRAEARLLNYDSEAVLLECRADPAAPMRQAVAAAEQPPLQRGPVILCLDTSGSMRGAPERIAKAVALQALRSAQAEGRGCKLIAFGAAQEVVEHDLAEGVAGLSALLDLVGQGFDGGTDVQTPIEVALQRVHEQRWRQADLLVVSDGEFGCTRHTLAQLDDARAQLGLRVQGVLVGDRETLGLLELCDHIHWVRDWRAHGGEAGASVAAGFSPVHSQSLTALFFPNALSERAARRR